MCGGRGPSARLRVVGSSPFQQAVKGPSAQPFHLQLLAVKPVEPSLLLPHLHDNLTLVSVI